MIYREPGHVSDLTKRLLRNDSTLKKFGFDFACVSEVSGLVGEFTRSMETCSLKNLRFEIYCNPNRCQEETFRYIKRMVQCNCIHDLFLHGDFSIDHFASIVEALSCNSAIQQLEIYNCHFGKEGATAIAKLLHSEMISLKSLLLEGSTMGDEGCSTVVEALRTYPSLKSLKMSYCHIGIEGAKAIGQFLRSDKCAIEEIRIQMNPISDEGCVAVMAGMSENSSIKVLGMDTCDIGKEGSEAIANALCSGKCAIEELGVEGNIDIRDEECVLIIEALRNNNSICKLDLSDCNIGDEGMKSIANVLQNNHGAFLRNLSLSGNIEIGLEGFVALTIALSKNSSLEDLDLSYCHVCDQECFDLMDALSQNSSLKVINLGNCHIHNEGGKSVANFLKSNTGSIHELNLQGNDLDEEALFEIANALHFNTHLIKLSLGYVGQEDVWIEFDDATHCNYSLKELDMHAYYDNHVFEYKREIKKNLDDNKALGPVKAEMHKTGLFPHWILPCLTSDSGCFVEALSKVASLEYLSPLFDLVCERPMFFDLDHCVAERPAKNAVWNEP